MGYGKVITVISPKVDLYNSGKCFTKGERYEVVSWNKIQDPVHLMEVKVLNDQGEPHMIGLWYREFEIVE